MSPRECCSSNLILSGALASVLGNLEPSAKSEPATGSRLAEECRGRVVLATLMSKLPRDEHTALIHGYVPQECYLKFAQENRPLCGLRKGEGSRAVEGGPQELGRHRARRGGERRIWNPRAGDQITPFDWSGKDAEPVARITVRAAYEA